MTARQAAPLAMLGLLLLAASALAGEAAAKPATKAAPKGPPQLFHVWADRIRYVQSKNRAYIQRNVTIMKGDLRIDCDDVEAHLKPGTNQFERIVATGNVRVCTVKPIAKRDHKRPKLDPLPNARRAACDRAEYDPATEVVVLTGTGRRQPSVEIGRDRVWGDTIVYNRRSGKLDMTGHVRLSARVPVSQGRINPLGPTPKPAPTTRNAP